MTRENAAAADVFADRAVLSPAYVPDRLVGREEELANVEYALNPMIFGREPDDVLVHGPRGTGKTACARYSARRQTRYAREQGLSAGCAYVDCLRVSTGVRAIRAVANQLNDAAATDVVIPESGLSTAEYRDRLRAILETGYDAAVVVFDRLDHLGSDVDAVLGHGAPASCVVSHIGVVDGDAGTGGIDDAVRGALAGTEQAFDRYDADALAEILRDRRKAFAEGRLDPAALDRAADLAAADGGNATTAVALLRLAGDRVRGGDGVVGPAAVAAAAEAVDHVLLQDRLAPLAEHARLVARALASLTREHGGAFRTRRVSDTYAACCRERERSPRTERRVLDFLHELARLGLTEQSTHWGGRADGNYKTHRLTAHPATVLRALGDSPGEKSL